MLYIRKFAYSCLLICCLVTFTGCGGAKKNTSNIDPELNIAQEYLEKAKNAKGTERINWLLSAAEALYSIERPEKALSILQKIEPTNLDSSTENWFYSLLGRGLYKAEKFTQSITQFSSVTDVNALKIQHRIDYHDYYASALGQLDRHFEAAKQRILQLSLISDELELEAIKEILWQHLISIPNPSLYQTSLNNRTVEGWLDLAIIAQNYADNPEDMVRALEIWSSRYRSVIPPNLVPLDLSRAMSVEIYQPKRLAVLLPMTGALAESAEQIRRGLLAAHFESNSNSELIFLDTSTEDVLQRYQQAIDMNCQFVLGPLQQSQVTKLAQSEYLPIPVLAINRLSDDQLVVPENFYQFGLPIEDEVKLIAEHVLSKGQQRGLLLLPDTMAGDRAFTAFQSVFKLQDAKIQQVTRYREDGDYSKPIQQMLGIDQSLQRHSRLEQLTGVSMEFQARRRQDIEFIFFIADPATGRRIKPFIDFYYAHDIPIYASSRIYRGIEDEVLDSDLNNVEFPTIPFLLSAHEETQSLRKSVETFWSDSQVGISANLFALGYDAYQIIPELSKLKYFPNYRQAGMSGQLSVNEQGHVLRQLTWANFINGRVKITKLEGPNVAQFQAAVSP